jgi:sporulation protein YlmC with PRC-barrel domain
MMPGAASVQVATPEANAFSLQALAGKPVHGASQEVLGILTDFLIEPQTGKVEYAVVPSGVDAAGETYRLIPIAALDPASGTEGLRTHVSKAQWNQVGTLPDRQLRGAISLHPAHRQQFNQQYGLGMPAPGTSGALVRVSELRGKTLQTWGQQLGTIQDVAIDVRHQVAAAVVTPTDTTLGAGQTFLVPFTQLQIGSPDQSAINTVLTREHFQQALSGMPTGLPGSPFAATGTPDGTVAMTVRQALDQDPSVAGANVHVVPETRIRLHGTVTDEQTRSNIERIAKEAAPGVQVDNHIAVQGGNR